MAKRIIKSYNERRNEILAVAEKLFFRNGYDATPVEAIIRDAGISKGAFYHYFTSKDELLDALALERAQEAFNSINSLVFDNNLNGIERMVLFTSLSKSWKLKNRDLLMAISRVMLAPENVIMREKFFQKQIAIAKPTLTAIIKQGIDEGLFSTPYPDDIGEMLFSLLRAASSEILSLAIDVQEHPENIPLMLHKMSVVQNMYERILGAPEGSIVFSDEKYLKAFFFGEDGTASGSDADADQAA